MYRRLPLMAYAPAYRKAPQWREYEEKFFVVIGGSEPMGLDELAPFAVGSRTRATPVKYRVCAAGELPEQFARLQRNWLAENFVI